MKNFARHMLSVAVAAAISGTSISTLAETSLENRPAVADNSDDALTANDDAVIEEVVAVGVIFEGQAKARAPSAS